MSRLDRGSKQTHQAPLSIAGFVLALLLDASTAHADHCRPSTGYSTCFDANALWPAAGPTDFITLPGVFPRQVGHQTLAVFVEYVERPIVLTAASPDPLGREIGVVGERIDVTPLFGFTPSERFRLDVALPLVARQSGTGVEGITSQRGAALERSALRDPRLSVGYQLFRVQLAPHSRLGAMAISEVSFPLGDRDRFSGSGTPIFAPNVSVGWETRAWFASAMLGARLHERRRFSGFVLGSQAALAFGAGVRPLGTPFWTISSELWSLPSLAKNATAEPMLPAEALLSTHFAPNPIGPSFLLGAGLGIPLSRDGSGVANPADWITPVSVPRYRAFLGVRYSVPP